MFVFALSPLFGFGLTLLLYLILLYVLDFLALNFSVWSYFDFGFDPVYFSGLVSLYILSFAVVYCSGLDSLYSLGFILLCSLCVDHSKF